MTANIVALNGDYPAKAIMLTVDSERQQYNIHVFLKTDEINPTDIKTLVADLNQQDLGSVTAGVIPPPKMTSVGFVIKTEDDMQKLAGALVEKGFLENPASLMLKPNVIKANRVLPSQTNNIQP
jgi:hypothetical protein